MQAGSLRYGGDPEGYLRHEPSIMQKEKILIVDDEEDLVKLVKYHLERDGYKVLSAGNGKMRYFWSEGNVRN